MGPEDQSTGYLLPLEDMLKRKQGLIQSVIRAVLFNQLKRGFDSDLLSLLGLQDVEFREKGFAYNIPSEEAAVRVHGCTEWQGLLAAHALLVRSSLCSDYLSASMPFSRVAAQPFLPG